MEQRPWRVIDLSEDPAGGYAGRLLATHGAEVVKVEHPAGSGYRRHGLFAGDTVDPDRSLLSAYLDCSKSSIRLDPRIDDDARSLDSLLASADAVILSVGSATPAAWPDPGVIAERHSHLVVTPLSPFGLSGPYRDLPATPIVLEAASGWLYQVGEPAGEPVRIRGELASAVIPGVLAAVGTLAALRWRRLGGTGQTVEVSRFEAMVAANRYFETTYAQTGDLIGRCGSMLFPYYGYTEAADGWTAPCAITPRHVDLLAEMIGPAAGPDAGGVRRWFATQDRLSLFHRGQSKKIPWGYLATAGEVLGHEQLQERSSFTTIDHPVLGRVKVPGTAARVVTDGGAVQRPPLLGEHDADLADLTRERTVPAGHGPAPARPLEGIRIVDITSWWAGPMAALILAQLGAEVIKVESVGKLDAWRSTLSDTASPRWWETSPLYNSVQRHKFGLTLDLTDQRGADLLHRLVARSDMVIENLQPKVLPSLGLGYDELRRVNPRLVMVSQSGFGQTGPWRDYGSLAQVGESLAGIGLITGHADGPPMLAGTFIGDALSATHAAFAALLALEELDRTGTGQHVDLAQLEASLPVTAEAVLDWQVNGRAWGRIGNRHLEMAPHGCYPTLVDDEWVALAVADDDEWQALAELVGEDWARDPRFRRTAGRLEAADELDGLLLSWTVPRPRDMLVDELRAAGLRAGPVQDPAGVLADRHLAARAFFETIDRAVVGPLPYPGLGIRFSATPPAAGSPAPLLGEHNHIVLGGLLGLSDDELTDLERDGVIGTRPIADGHEPHGGMTAEPTPSTSIGDRPTRKREHADD